MRDIDTFNRTRILENAKNLHKGIIGIPIRFLLLPAL